MLEPALTESFRIDPDHRAPIVEIVVDRYDDLFNALDRAPIRRRDLSPTLKQYLQESSLWVPLPHPIVLEVQVTEEARDEARQREVAAGIRAYFAHLIHVARSEVRSQRIRIGRFVGLSFLSMSAGLMLEDVVDRERVVSAFLLNGLTVGGWVFLWEALSIVFVRRFDQQAQIARHQRLVDAPIRFQAAEERAVATSCSPGR